MYPGDLIGEECFESLVLILWVMQDTDAVYPEE